MKTDNFKYMNRQVDSGQVSTRLLVNGKIEGGSRIVKLPGYANKISSDERYGGGTITLDKVFVFKDARHSFASSKTFFALDGDTLYYWNGSAWQAVTIDGRDAPDFNTPRFWYERGNLHISGGPTGKAAIYKYIDRQIANEEGYFANTKEFEGFWFGREKVPEFENTDGVNDTFYISGGTALYDGNTKKTDKCVEVNSYYYALGVYVLDDESLGIPTKSGMTSRFYDSNTDNAESWVPVIGIMQTPGTLDERIVGIDLYVAKSGAIEYKKDYGNNWLSGIIAKHWPQIIRTGKGELEWESMDFRFLKRVDINGDTVIHTTTAESTAVDTLKYVAALGAAGFFPSNLVAALGIKYKKTSSNSWSYAAISSYDNDGSTQTIKTSGSPFDGSSNYAIQIVAKWIVDGSYKTKTIPWRYDGSVNDGIDERGDSFDVSQPYSLVEEYQPEANFHAVQNRRTFILDYTTDERHRNGLGWSEIDAPANIPNGNLLLLSTLPDEEAKGLCAINGGLLALYEKSCHLIRMTGEPVTYDAEEGKFEIGCIASYGVIVIDEIARWPGIDGIKMFTNEPIDLTEEVLMDDYKSIITSEYTNNNNSYEGIVVGHSQKQNLIVWSFPNSTYAIGDLTVNLLIYHIGKGFFFGESDKTFKWLFEGYNGELYGVDDDGIYELFAGTPDELNRRVFESGIMSNEMASGLIEKVRLTYKGTPTLKIYANRESTAVIDEVFSEKTSVGQESHFVMTMGDELQIRVESAKTTDEEELNKIEFSSNQIAMV